MVSIARLAGATFFAAFAGLAAMLTADNLRFEALPKVAMIIQEDREAFAGEALDRFVTLARAVGDSKTCRSDHLRPALSVWLVHASRQDVSEDYAAWEKALTETSAFLRHMIGCMPAEGNVWIRDVMVTRTIAEDPRSMAEKAAIAAALWPYERTQLEARLAVWATVSDATLALSDATMRADVRTVLRYGDRPLVQSLYLEPSAPLAAAIEQEFATLDVPRQLFVRKAIEATAQN